MPTLTLTDAVELLRRHHLLREIIQGDIWTLDAGHIADANTPLRDVTYDTRQVKSGSLLFIKGRFQPEFLANIDSQGLSCYVAQREYSSYTRAPGIIVENVQQSMSLIAAEFFGRPQDELTMIGITGTKGKTTTAYFAHAIMNAYSQGKAALSSSVTHCLDGVTFEPSRLTTPESLDSFRMMRKAVDNGMRYFVMEVSSQAYKVNRVYGLTFDIGVFLNISPDHISEIEHPTFEDYFYCKRQLISHSRKLVLCADCDYAELIKETAAATHIPVITFAVHDVQTGRNTSADIVADVDSHDAKAFTVSDIDGRKLSPKPPQARITTLLQPLQSQRTVADAPPSHEQVHDAQKVHDEKPTYFEKSTHLEEPARENRTDTSHKAYRLSMSGEFNIANALAAITIAYQAGVPDDSCALQTVDKVQVPGRMERFDIDERTVAYVDFAHNYLSTKALIEEVEREYGKRHPRIAVVCGSTGGKALDRREGIVKGALNHAESFIFTTDDPNFDDPRDIAEEMQSYVTDPVASTRIVIDRERAIETALTDAREHRDRFNVLLIIGKGDEHANVINGKHEPYAGDAHVLRRLIAGQQTDFAGGPLVKSTMQSTAKSSRTLPVQLSAKSPVNIPAKQSIGLPDETSADHDRDHNSANDSHTHEVQ